MWLWLRLWLPVPSSSSQSYWRWLSDLKCLERETPWVTGPFSSECILMSLFLIFKLDAVNVIQGHMQSCFKEITNWAVLLERIDVVGLVTHSVFGVLSTMLCGSLLQYDSIPSNHFTRSNVYVMNGVHKYGISDYLEGNIEGNQYWFFSTEKKNVLIYLIYLKR